MAKIHENLPRMMQQTRDEYRDKIDLLRRRAILLTGKDKLLMTMYLDNSNSYRQLARLAGVDDANIARRIKRIIKRLVDGTYLICLRNSDKFTAAEVDIAKEFFLLGFSMRKIAARRQWTYYRVRQTIKKIGQFTKDSDRQK
jgi:predicted DNA-binding protein YlxM (UPF0122 family)